MGKGLLKHKITLWQARKLACEASCQADNEHGKTAFIKAREKAVASQSEVRGAKW